MRWCRCTSSSQDTYWPGTSERFYTAASSSEPSSRRRHRYQSQSPGFKQIVPPTRTHMHAHTHRFTQSIKLINRGLWRSTVDNGPLKSIVQPFVVYLNGCCGVWIFSPSDLKPINCSCCHIIQSSSGLVDSNWTLNSEVLIHHLSISISCYFGLHYCSIPVVPLFKG